MELEKRSQLTAELQKQVAAIAADLKRQLELAGPARTRAEAVYRDERVGYDFDVWLDLLARRAAVLWVLKTVYVRVLEDRGFLSPVRIRDRESQELFEHLTPGLGDTAYLRWVFKDLASNGGLPELFAPQPAEVALPSNELSRELLQFWRSQDEATHVLRFRFDGEHFDGRLMGDLYQDLDPVVKERYALLQTPDFVVQFMLDETLTPAMVEFGVEAVRVLDPACGSGHFLLAAFKRLVSGMRKKYPEMPIIDVVRNVLARLVGIDLNDYACALARARIVMTALETVGDTGLAAGGRFHPQVFWADGLEQVESDEQLEIGFGPSEALRATLTRPEVRKALRPILKAGFHVVVANPPYITEKDPKQREYHREKIGKSRRYVSAVSKYSLCSPFTERAFSIAKRDGYIGLLNADSFATKSFGKALVELVLAANDLTKVVDMSAVAMPGYGTSTIIILARARAPITANVPVITTKKRDVAADQSGTDRVWQSIAEHHADTEFENEYIEVSARPQRQLQRHEWQLGGSEHAALIEKLERAGSPVSQHVKSVGIMCFTLCNDAFVRPLSGTSAREGHLPIRPFVAGAEIRDWSVQPTLCCLFPYSETFDPIDEHRVKHTQLWSYRTLLANGVLFGGVTKVDGGYRWYEYGRLTKHKFATDTLLVYSFKNSQNSFALSRAPHRVYDTNAHIVQLEPGAKRDDFLHLLGILNSSVASLFLKSISKNIGYTVSAAGARLVSEDWEDGYQLDGNKVEKVPVPSDRSISTAFASALDDAARERDEDGAGICVVKHSNSGAPCLRRALDERRRRDTTRLLRMVALQEELDWLCYRLFGIDLDAPIHELRSPHEITVLRPGLRPFEITLARGDQERRDAIERNEEPDEAPTAWFERHGWTPAPTLDELSESERRVVAARLARTKASRDLSLVEQATYKRRWYRPDYLAEEQEALETWLSERLEGWAKERREPFTVEEAASALQADPAVIAVAEVLTGRPDFNLVELVAERIHEDAVPSVKHHIFKPSGLTKRAAWERTWEMQRAEDEAAKRGTTAPAPPVPPKYAKNDYLCDSYWALRGALDVPKERFIALTEVPGRAGNELLFAWAGLTHRERAKMLVDLDEVAERSGIGRADRIGILHGVWFLADYVAWESEQAARQYRAAVTTMVGQAGVTDELLSEWAARHPAPKLRRPKAKPKKQKDSEEADES